MIKVDIERRVSKWLNDENPDGDRQIISCGRMGVIIAMRENNNWKLCWADQIIIYSDIHNGYLTRKEATGQYVCDVCGRTFNKLFAISLHRKKCKPQ